MQILPTVENFLFDRLFGVQNVVTAIERWTGIKYHTQARGLAVLMLASVVQAVIWDFPLATNAWWLFASSVIIGFRLSWVGFYMTSVAQRATDRGYKNPYREDEGCMFARFVYINIVLFGGMVSTLYYPHLGKYVLCMLVATVMFYVMACDDAPPQQRLAKIRLC